MAKNKLNVKVRKKSAPEVIINPLKVKVALYDRLLIAATARQWKKPNREEVLKKNACFEIVGLASKKGQKPSQCRVEYTKYGAEFSGDSVAMLNEIAGAYIAANTQCDIETELSVVVKSKSDIKKVLASIQDLEIKEFFLESDLDNPISEDEIESIKNKMPKQEDPQQVRRAASGIPSLR